MTLLGQVIVPRSNRLLQPGGSAEYQVVRLLPPEVSPVRNS